MLVIFFLPPTCVQLVASKWTPDTGRGQGGKTQGSLSTFKEGANATLQKTETLTCDVKRKTLNVIIAT